MDNTMIRVLVTAFAPVPGSSPHASAVMGLVAAIRAEMDMVTIKTESLSHMEHYGDARLYRVPIGMGSAAEQRQTFGRACLRQLEAQHYDVVHVRGAMEGRVLAEHKKDFGFRFVYEMATFPDEAEGVDIEKRWGEAHEACADAADLILVPTQAAARGLSSSGHAGKVAVVHPGVDVNGYDWWPAATDATARLLYLGGFGADRDLSTVLSAVKEVHKVRPVEVLVAGEPDMDVRERLRRVVKSFGLADVVTVRGEPTPLAIPMVIGASDICLAPAAAAPRFQDLGDLPQPLLEYLACRRPVIAAGVPGVAEVLRDDKEGLLYPPGDHEALKDAVLTLLGNDTRRERLVESAYDRVRWMFSDGARRRRVAEVYEMLTPGSQLYDAWVEGFPRDVTGSVDLEALAMLEAAEQAAQQEDSGELELSAEDLEPADPETLPPDGVYVSEPPAPYEGEVLYRPGQTGEIELPNTNPRHVPDPRHLGPDDPAAFADMETALDVEDDLAAVPTTIAATPTEVTERRSRAKRKETTDEVAPPARKEPDTGPVRNPD
jgi:glycosyltransferase involved in cell wall biosynthesis